MSMARFLGAGEEQEEFFDSREVLSPASVSSPASSGRRDDGWLFDESLLEVWVMDSCSVQEHRQRFAKSLGLLDPSSHGARADEEPCLSPEATEEILLDSPSADLFSAAPTFACRGGEPTASGDGGAGTEELECVFKNLDDGTVFVVDEMELINNEWFKKGYQSPRFETADVNLDDVNSIFNESGDPAQLVVERREERPSVMNAFELISTSQVLNLGTLFEKQTGSVKRETRFASRLPANEILSKIEAALGPMGFNVQKRNYKLKLQGENPGRKGQLAIATILEEEKIYEQQIEQLGNFQLRIHDQMIMLEAAKAITDTVDALRTGAAAMKATAEDDELAALQAEMAL